MIIDRISSFKLQLLFFSIVFQFKVSTVTAQVFPVDGSKVNYRLVGFSFDKSSLTSESKIEIAKGWFNNLDSFVRKIVKTEIVSKNKVIVEVPSFGAEYTWRVVGKNEKETKFYHFITGKSDGVNTNLTQLHVTQDAIKYQDAYIFSDKNRCIYDMKGNPVWYLPEINGLITNTTQIRNLRISPVGTITFLAGSIPCEIDYSGKVLWQPRKLSTKEKEEYQQYHHEFRRLKSGNYMAMGSEQIHFIWKKISANDSVMEFVKEKFDSSGNRLHNNMQMGTIVELNKAGEIVWKWRSSEHLKETNSNYPNNIRAPFTNHENSYYFNEKKKLLYISYKKTNQIIKVKYPEGKVLNVYGNINNIGDDDITEEDYLFNNQHSCKVSDKGFIYLFSNNMNSITSLPAVVKLKEPAAGIGTLQKIWEYTYPTEIVGEPEKSSTNGGNVVELPDESIFVSMCHPFGNTFIIDQNKQILWNAVLVKWNGNLNRWEQTDQYRGSIIESYKKFEQLVFNR